MTDTREETTSHEALLQSQDMPPGSAVLQISMVKDEATGELEMRIEGVLIGTDQFDPMNPCHRFLSVIADHLPELMDEIGADRVERVSGAASVAANDATVADDAAIAG